MVTDTYSKMMPGMSMRSVLKSNDYDQDLAYLGWQQRPQEAPTDRENDLSPYRSGSAPPTVEGSLTAVGGFYESSGIAGLKKIGGQGFVTEEDLRADPAYVNYYYSNGNLNPRLPPPLLSKEDWRFSRRLQGGAGGGMAGCDGGEVGSVNRSLFSVQPGIGGKEDNGVEWGGDGLIGLPSLGLGTRKKSIAEMIQDDLNQGMSVSRHGSSRPASRNAFDDHPENSDTQFTHLRSGVNRQRAVSSVQDNIVSLSSSLTYASTLGGSLSRSSTPDPTLSARAPSPCLPPVGGGRVSSKTNPMASPNMNETSDLAASFSTMNLSANGHLDNNTHNNAKRKFNLHSTAMHKGEGGSPSHYLNVDNGNNSLYPEYGFSGYALSPSLPSMVGGPLGGGNLPPLFENAAAVSAMGLNGMDGMSLGGFALGPNMLEQAMELQNMGSRMGNQLPPGAPAYLPYLRSNEYATELDKEYMNNAYIDLLGAQKAYLGELLSPPKCQFTIPYVGKSNSTLNFGYYRDPAFGLGMSYPGSPMASPLFPNSPVGSGSPVKHNERSLRYGMRNLAGGNLLDESFASSLLDEFKSNKTKCFELSEITGHVVEFSSDQYGSRFIQQKLETASVEEKNMIFHEIKPQALSLMTDVFGNYVIQKFFEHGTASQIRELANELADHVLTLSLQMYGCRVIQKAVEVVDLDQQTQMVMELDGHIMRCVRDQNGNHVIQKCIECVPENAIQFIVLTFYDQVVTLSTHPYGCRVVQRVLEHCHDPKTQQIMMDEILNSVCMLAQDQYGNYVVQHVLEHGKPEERSSIIKKLTGQIVKMSQQKFASNVIEKCLTFGNPVERQILVNEMLCTTEENEPLQVLMKDQFANYVVQKVLETCDDQQLEMILNRIKIHLNALKKYTYGKHIVARVEKLVAAGEKRISFMSLQAPQMA